MTSLFSSFDLYLFQFSFLFFIFFLSSLLLMFYNFKTLYFLYSWVFNFLSMFFNSLTNFNSSKFLNFFMITSMTLIFLFNFSSIFSFNFAFTSQPSMVFFLSIYVWLALMMFSFKNNMAGQLLHFIPEGCPLILAPFLFLIEMASCMIRPLTLMIRLVANILAGHVLIILLSNLIMNFSLVFPLLPLLNSIEIFVALIQSYIFVTLISLYYNDL